MRITIALVVGCATSLGASLAFADSTAQDKALAQSLFREGRALLLAGKTAQACAKLGESDRLDPEIGTHLNVALCHETLGKTASAWVEFGEVADQADRLHDVERGTFARQHAQELDKKLSRVRLRAAHAPADLVVEIDGRAIGGAAFDTPIPLDPGSHELRATAVGKTTVTQRFEVPVGPSSIEVTVPVLRRPTTVAVAEPVSPSGLRTAGFVIGGVGLAGIALGSIFGGLAFVQNGTANDHCPYNGGTGCDPQGVAAGSDASTSALVSTIAFVGGAACLAAGVIFVVIGKPSAAARVGVVPGFGSLFLRGSF